MKKVFFLILSFFIFLFSVQGATPLVETLSDVKMNKTTGRVFLSGRYQANGRFKSDHNFLSGGRIYFTLGKEDYSYTLMDVLGHPDLLRKKTETQLRGLASIDKVPHWKLERKVHLGERKITFIPSDEKAPIKKIRIIIDAENSMKSIYLDFGTHNLSFFAS